MVKCAYCRVGHIITHNFQLARGGGVMTQRTHISNYIRSSSAVCMCVRACLRIGTLSSAAASTLAMALASYPIH